MSFRADVETEIGSRHYRTGLRALRQADRSRIRVADSARLSGSANLDTATQLTHPNAPRWDYLVGTATGSQTRLFWIEVHPAGGEGTIAEVAAKLGWLTAWLSGKRLGQYDQEIVWIATGTVAFNTLHPGIKALANKGCNFVGRRLDIR